MPFIAGPICDSKSALPEFMEDSNVVNMYFDERGSYLANYCTSGNGKYYYATGGSQDSNKYLYSIYAKNGTLYYTSNTYNYGNTYHTKLIMEVAGTGTATVKDITLIAPNDVTDTVMRNPIVFPIESNDKMLYILLTSGTNNPVYDVWYSYSLSDGSSTMLTYTSNSDLSWNSPSDTDTSIAIHGTKIYIGISDSGKCKINLFDTTTASYTRTSISKFTKNTAISLYALVGSPYIACILSTNNGNLSVCLWNPSSNTYIELKDSSGILSNITTILFPLISSGSNSSSNSSSGSSSSSSGSSSSGSSNSSGSSTSSGSTVASDDVTLLAAILQCEAQYDYDSMLAVATVIMNRVNSGRFPNSISGVVYASGQFAPVWTGSLDRVLKAGPRSLSIQVAQDAINGARHSSVSDCYYFLYAASTNRTGVVIGGNVFFTSW